MDASTTETFFGYTKTARSVGQIAAAALAGLVSNLVGSTRGVMAVGHGFDLASAGVYTLLERMSARRYAFLGAEALSGVGSGAINIWRVHIAMASTERDRHRAVALSQLAIVGGHTGGPMLVSAFAGVFGDAVPGGGLAAALGAVCLEVKSERL